MYGYELLLQHGIPVTEHKKTVYIRGKRNEVFEKARDFKKNEVYERFDELLKLVAMAGRNGLYIDTHIDNFGIDKRGRIVIRDTNFVELKSAEEAWQFNLSGLQQNIARCKVARPEIIEKISVLRRQALY